MVTHPFFKYLSNLMHSHGVLPLTFTLSVIILSGCANTLFYYPDQENYGSSPDQYQQTYSNHYWLTDDGVKLHGWFIPAQNKGIPNKPLGTVLFVHGNAANITNHYSLVAWLPQENVNLFIFDYRGFGQSEGRPTFKGTDLDTASALKYLKGLPAVDANKIIVIGQSLGGNSAIAAVAKDDNRQGIQGMIIDSTFYNHSAIANHYLPAGALFISAGYGASSHIQSLSPIPLLFIHGTADEIIPYQHSERLYAQAKDPKELLLVPNIGHLSTLNENGVRQKIVHFIDKYLGND